MRNCLIYIVYPILTLAFASQSSLMEDNLSIVGNFEHLRFVFIGWGICTQIVLGLGFWDCLKHCLHQKQLKPLLIITSIINMIAIVLPYQPENYPQFSRIHVGLSFISLCSMLILLGFLLTSLMINHQIFYYYLSYVMFCFLIMGFYLHFTYVNSLVEVIVAITIPIYLDRLRRIL